MGYTTDFSGRFLLNKPLDDETYAYLIKFNETRRMARNLDPKYGVQGEFYVDGSGECGQGEEDNIIDFNKPPSTQPGLWCHWRPSEDRLGIEWDDTEKFYHYREWLDYLAKNFLNPKGYTLSGSVHYQGEDSDDYGDIDGSDPLVTGQQSEIIQTPQQPAGPPPLETQKPRRILWEV